MSITRHAYQLLLGIWLGALVCFAAIFAPVIFRTLGPSSGAIEVVTRTIIALDWMTIAVCFLLLLLAFLHEGTPGRRGWIRGGLFLAIILLAGVSHWVITPRLRAVHERAGGSAATLPADHPSHQEFQRLHRGSAAAMSGELVLGLITAGILLRPRSPSALREPVRESDVPA